MDQGSQEVSYGTRHKDNGRSSEFSLGFLSGVLSFLLHEKNAWLDWDPGSLQNQVNGFSSLSCSLSHSWALILMWQNTLSCCCRVVCKRKCLGNIYISGSWCGNIHIERQNFPVDFSFCNLTKWSLVLTPLINGFNIKVISIIFLWKNVVSSSKLPTTYSWLSMFTNNMNSPWISPLVWKALHQSLGRKKELSFWSPSADAMGHSGNAVIHWAVTHKNSTLLCEAPNFQGLSTLIAWVTVQLQVCHR